MQALAVMGRILLVLLKILGKTTWFIVGVVFALLLFCVKLFLVCLTIGAWRSL